MSLQTEEQIARKKRVVKKRIQINEIKKDIDFPASEVVVPTDLEVMFAGKFAFMCMQQEGRANTMIKNYEKWYGGIDPVVKERILEEVTRYSAMFEVAKNRASAITDRHPLWHRLQGIRGFSSYQLGMIMSYMKKPERFSTLGKLMIYAGVGSVNGISVTKGNILRIKEMYLKTGKEFKGFNTEFAGRMLGIIADCLIRANGFFYEMYIQKVKHLIHRCIMNDEIEIVEKDEKGKQPSGVLTEAQEAIDDLVAMPENNAHEETDDEKKRNKASWGLFSEDTYGYAIEYLRKQGYEGKLKAAGDEAKKRYVHFAKAEIYMKGKNNQSLKLFVTSNAKRRICSILLFLIWSEWLKLSGKEARVPYVFEYLGHKEEITLEQVLRADTRE